MDLSEIFNTQQRKSEDPKPMKTHNMPQGRSKRNQGFYLIAMKASYGSLGQNDMLTNAGKSFTINDLKISPHALAPAKLKMVKMKDEPTMLMKTQGTTTKCLSKCGDFPVPFAQISIGSALKPGAISQHSLGAFRRAIRLNCAIGLPFPPSAEATLKYSEGHAAAVFRPASRTSLVNSSCYFRVIAFEGSPVYRVCLPRVVSGKSRANYLL